MWLARHLCLTSCKFENTKYVPNQVDLDLSIGPNHTARLSWPQTPCFSSICWIKRQLEKPYIYESHSKWSVCYWERRQSDKLFFFLFFFCEMSLPRIIRGKLKKREKNPVERVCRCRIISLKVPGFEGWTRKIRARSAAQQGIHIGIGIEPCVNQNLIVIVSSRMRESSTTFRYLSEISLLRSLTRLPTPD